jgi:transcriptional regulator with XRE-family HTH domain
MPTLPPLPTLTVGSLGDYIREQRESAQVSLRQLADAAGVSNPYLSQIERGLRKPSADILQQIAKGLRISAEALYVRAGLLEDREGTAETETAIVSDPRLSERQKRVLLDIYASFVTESADSAKTSTTPTAPTRPKSAARSAGKKATKTKSAHKTAKRARRVSTQGPKE